MKKQLDRETINTYLDCVKLAEECGLKLADNNEPYSNELFILISYKDIASLGYCIYSCYSVNELKAWLQGYQQKTLES